MLYENLDDRFGVADVVIGIEFKFFEFGVLSDEVFYGVFKRFDDFGEFFLTGRRFDVEGDFVIYSEFLGDRQGVVGRASMIEMINLNL